jgi:predicted HicB family RNase H-like nuclease
MTDKIKRHKLTTRLRPSVIKAAKHEALNRNQFLNEFLEDLVTKELGESAINSIEAAIAS